MLRPGTTHLMRLLFPSSSSVQFRFRWTNPSSVTSPQIQWNLASAVPYCFMSTSPLDRHSDRTEVGPSSLNLANTTTPNWNPSSNESEHQLVLRKSGSIEAYFQAAKDGYSLEEKPQQAPWEERGLAVRSGADITTETTSTRYPMTNDTLAALRQRQPHQLLSSLLDEDPEFFVSLPDTLILQIVRSLAPAAFSHPLKLLYENVQSPSVMKRLAVSNGSFWKFLADSKLAYQYVVEKLFFRRQSLGFKKYQLLLNLASATGDKALAIETWIAMLAHNHKPDVVCYNYYFEAMCWHLSGPCLDNSDRSEKDIGVKGVVTRMFAKMIAEGVMADSKTFCLLMTACASEGDLESVNIVLKKVWHVDVDAIIEADDESKNHDDFLPGSALPPTSELLFTIAYCYGSTANIAVGMRIIYHLSRRFSLRIDDRTWDQLSKWTSVIRHRSSKYSLMRVEKSKRIPWWTSYALSYTMASTTSPTMPVLHNAIRDCYRADSLEQVLRLMVAGLVLHKKSSLTYFKIVAKIEKFKEKRYLSFSKLVEPSLSADQYKARLARLERDRDEDLIRQWVRMVLKGHRWLRFTFDKRLRRDQILVWQRQKLPEFLDVFRPYNHRGWGAAYTIRTGRVWLRDWRLPWSPVASRDFDLNEYLVEDTSQVPTH